MNHLKHPFVLASFGAVALISVGSAVYYMLATRPPAANVPPADAQSTRTIYATGTIEPSQNPNLAFQSGGLLARLPARVGETVAQGQLLASLDTATLFAQRAQAAANLAAAQARLAELQAGPRQVDIQAKQTAIDQAASALAQMYAAEPANIRQAYDKSFSGVPAYTDALFNQANSANPSLAFQTTDNQTAIDAGSARALINTDLPAWSAQIAGLSSTSEQQGVDAAIDSAVAHLGLVREYCNTLLAAIARATPSSASFTASGIASAQAQVGTFRDSTNSLIIALQSDGQKLAAAKLAVQAAQNELSIANAGATKEQLDAQAATVAAAQASVQTVDAQIANATIRAPFAGTISSVHANEGDVVAANTPIVSLTPASGLQIRAYVSESDAASIRVGDQFDATIDAFPSEHFSATVASVDHSPSMQNGVPAYKITLQFTKQDTRIASGMTANISLTK